MNNTTTYPDRLKRNLITLSTLIAVFLVTLDGTIATIALPQIQSSLSASQEQIVWVLTSYMLASVIATPLSGWLAERFGRKRIMVLSVAGFTLSSLGCGISTSLGELVLFRIVQGMTGASLVPLSQATFLDINPPENHGPAMALYGTGTLLGPLIGPTLGGWLTEYVSWHAVFLINVPFGILGCLGLILFMSEHRREDKISFDLFGFTALSIALASLQLMLDRGQQLDWFSSTEICIEAGIAASLAYIAVIHMLTTSNPFIKPGLFNDRNFSVGSILATLLGVFVVAVVPIMTTMMQQLFGYPVLLTGIVSAPRAVGNILTMLLMGRFVARVDARYLIIIGMLLTAGSLYTLATMTLDSDQHTLMVATFIQGCGSGFLFVPLTLVVFSTLRREYRNEGSTLFALTRNLGAAIGISYLQAFTIRDIAPARTQLVDSVRVDNFALAWPTPDFDITGSAPIAWLEQEVMRQATMTAYLDSYRLLFILALAMTPLALFMRSSRKSAAEQPAMHIE
ncbi:MAG TPA: DHA2 family efflux MFS transporter permease subunit [Spongiibacteraceae bacterium]|nr:DHA2 family efflux MFS transporter permease subunit [Spongiibacteraceae bacterium]